MSHLADLRDEFDASQEPVTVSRGTRIYWDSVDQALERRAEELQRARFGLASDLRVLLHLTPAPPTSPALDAIEAAIREVEALRELLRKSRPK